jgi:hypothetical protein
MCRPSEFLAATQHQDWLETPLQLRAKAQEEGKKLDMCHSDIVNYISMQLDE